MFTHALLQFVSPVAHATVHAPCEQTGVAAGQTLPQAPQLRGSLWVAVQTPPLHLRPWFGQPHLPWLQEVPPVHRMPHPPQFELSFCSSAQVAPQTERPDGQTQAPPLQVWPIGQTWPHAPQLALSFCSSTHVIPQVDWPAGQTQALPTQLCAAKHAFPHAPQLSRSVVASTQTPLHGI